MDFFTFSHRNLGYSSSLYRFPSQNLLEDRLKILGFSRALHNLGVLGDGGS